MKTQQIYDREIKKIINRDNVHAILLVGAGSKVNRKDFHKLNDIDIFVINSKESFEREIINIDGVDFDISYMPLKVLDKVILNKQKLMIKILKNAKIVYKNNEDIDNYLKKIKCIYENGLKPLSDYEIKFERFKLYESYKDILNGLEDDINTLFLINNLFKDILKSFLKLNNSWLVKDKKILKKIKKQDKKLYNLCEDFLKAKEIKGKLKKIKILLDYVLKPYGGVLKYWPRGKYPIDK
ncbi:MAG: hypothetical protein FH753_00115 [Firmicutes bacterium]|nr:hypothetical protein [Bacillota bacterium]